LRASGGGSARLGGILRKRRADGDVVHPIVVPAEAAEQSASEKLARDGAGESAQRRTGPPTDKLDTASIGQIRKARRRRRRDEIFKPVARDVADCCHALPQSLPRSQTEEGAQGAPRATAPDLDGARIRTAQRHARRTYDEVAVLVVVNVVDSGERSAKALLRRFTAGAPNQFARTARDHVQHAPPKTFPGCAIACAEPRSDDEVKDTVAIPVDRGEGITELVPRVRSSELRALRAGAAHEHPHTARFVELDRGGRNRDFGDSVPV